MTTAIALTVCAGSLAFYDRWSFSLRLGHELTTYGEVLGANSAAALEFGDKAGAAEVLRAVSANHRIDIVVLYDRNGNEFVRYTQPEAAQRFPGGFGRNQIIQNGKFTSQSPIRHNGEFLGTILLEEGEGDLAARSQSYFVVAGLLIGIAVVIAVLVATGLQASIFDPIAKLVTSMEGIAERKDYSLRVATRSNDEIGRLVETFNVMLAEIQTRDNDLELTIDERTKAFVAEVEAKTSLQETQSALEKALKEANAANEAKSLFLAKISHEIRTPMNGVLGMTEILLGTELNHLQLQCAETIERSARNLLAIINDVLDFSKAEAEKLFLRSEPFRIEDVVGEVGAILSPAAHNKGLSLCCWCAPETPEMILGDEGRLRQVLLNLVGNAVKFTEKGQVSLDVSVVDRNDPRTVRFEVRDTGVGIPKEKQAHIFESFMQVDGNRNRRQGGTGLGLTISRQLVELMGGSISVVSEPDQGSVFAFEITPEVRQPAQPWVRLQGITALLVGTNRDFGQKIVQILHFHRSEAEQATSEVSFREFLSQRQWDFIVLDVENSPMYIEEIWPLIGLHDFSPKVIAISPPGTNILSSQIGEANLAGVLTPPIVASKLLNMMANNAEPSSQSRSRTGEASIGDRAPNILLVEDNDVNAIVATHFLANLGCRFKHAVNGQEAVEMASQETYDLILMDVQMPILDGLEATRTIRISEGSSLDKVVIVAMTANAFEVESQACMEAGMDDYLPKPVSQKALGDMLHKWLDKELAVRTTN